MDKLLLAAALAIFGVHGTAMMRSWYYLYPWIDIPLHIAGGAFVGLLFYYLFIVRQNLLATKAFLPTIALGLGFVALVGVLWEFYEFFLDVFVIHAHPLMQEPGPMLFDTLKDLFDDLLGGLMALCACRYAYPLKVQEKRESF